MGKAKSHSVVEEGGKTTVVVQDVEEFGKHLDKAAASLEGRLGTSETFKITKAVVKDDLCNYDIEVTSGVGIGFTHNIKGKGIVDDDLLQAFSKLNVHLACVDDVFKNAGVAITRPSKLATHELALLYDVNGFQIKGTKGDQYVILSGKKTIDASTDRQDIVTPKILIDKFSNYKWWKDLKSCIHECIVEVELYHEGKYTLVDQAPADPVIENQGKLDMPEKEAPDPVLEGAKV